jgi:hypothetical protein
MRNFIGAKSKDQVKDSTVFQKNDIVLEKTLTPINKSINERAPLKNRQEVK